MMTKSRIGGTALFASLIAAVLPTINAAPADLSTCQRSQIQQLTNQFENSQNNLAFDYCQDIKDGRGFTCGIVGFTTSTRDAFQVIDDYSKDPAYNREFDPYMDRLRELNSTQAESTAGLDGFCNTWYSTAANSSAFRAVQVARADALYYNPSQAIAEKYGVTAPLARGQLYDAAIQHGLEPDPDSMPSMAARVPRPAGMDDATWISAFMTERSRTLCNPSTKATQKAWCASVTRVKSYQFALAQNELNLSADTLTALDNDGKQFSIPCNPDLWTQYIAGKTPDELAAEKGGSTGLKKAAIIAITVIVLLVALALVGWAVYRKRRYGNWRSAVAHRPVKTFG